MPFTITATKDTYLKSLPVQSQQLKASDFPEQFIPVDEGTELTALNCSLYNPNPDDPGEDHLFIDLEEPPEGYTARRWFLYAFHAIAMPDSSEQADTVPRVEAIAETPNDTPPGNLLTIERDTIAKTQPIASEDLSDSNKANLRAGTVLTISRSAGDRNQHLCIDLETPISSLDSQASLQRIYVYEPHTRPPSGRENAVIRLPVQHASQLDNDTSIFGPGWRQCNVTSNSMLADHLLNGELTEMAARRGYHEAESVFMREVAPFGDTVNHDAQTRGLAELGIESYFSYTISSADLLMSLELGIPMVIGVAYKSSGHICLVVGHDPKRRVWLVHCPYGTREGASDNYQVGVGGDFDPYSYQTFDDIFWDRGREAGWGRVITAVNGRPTGMPAGL